MDAREQLEKTPPYSGDAEYGLLGAVMWAEEAKGETAKRVAGRLTPAAFYFPHTRALFGVVSDLAKRGVAATFPTVAQTVNDDPALSRLIDAETLTTIGGLAGGDIDHFIGVLLEQQTARDARNILNGALVDLLERRNPSEVLASTRDALDRLNRTDADGAIPTFSGDVLAAEAGEMIDFLPLLGRSGYIPRGWCTLLASQPKCGKTTLLSSLLAEWVGESVLVFTEEPRSLWASRIQRSGRPMGHVNFAFALGYPIDRIVRTIQAKRPTVVAVDTVRSVLGLAEENDNSAVCAAIAPLIRAAREQDTTLLLLHHHRKAAGANGEQVAGAHSLVAAVDVLLELRRAENAKTRRTVTGLGRLIEIDDLLVELTEAGDLVALGDPGAVAEDACERQLRLVAPNDWFTVADAREELADPKPSVNQVRNVLNRLVERGAFLRDPPGGGRGRQCKYRRAG